MALLKKSPKDSRDFKYSEIRETNGEIPLYIDLRGTFGVMNQGSTSKCVAYACAALKHYQEKINNKRNIEFAPDFIYERKEFAGNGMYLRTACKILKEIGCCRQSVYNSTTELATRLKDAENWKINSYAAVSSIEDCKRAIALQGPVIIMTKCYNKGPMFWCDDGKNKNAENHATLLVGYGTNGFILQNSWGSGWAKRGYTNFPFSDFGAIIEAWTMLDTDKVVMPDVYVDIINNPGMTTQKKCCLIC